MDEWKPLVEVLMAEHGFALFRGQGRTLNVSNVSGRGLHSSIFRLHLKHVVWATLGA